MLDRQATRRYERASLALSALLLSLAVLLALGWIFQASFLGESVSLTEEVQIEACVGFFLIAVSLLAFHAPRERLARTVGIIASAFVVLFAIYETIEIVWDTGLGQSSRFISDSAATGHFLPSMPPSPIGVLLTVGVATLILHTSRRPRWVIISQTLSFVGVVAVLVLLIGYASASEEFIAFGGSDKTAIGTLGATMLSVASLMLATPQRGIVGYLRQRTPPALLLRWLIPIGFLVPLVLAMVRVNVRAHPGIDEDFALAINVTAVSLVFMLLIAVVTVALHRDSAKREASARALQEAGRLAGLGRYELDTRTGRMSWSDGLREIIGVPVDDVRPQSLDAYLELVHPLDRDMLRESLGHGGSLEHRITRPDGQVRTLVGKCTIETNPAGDVTHAWGILQDVTNQKDAEETLLRSERLNLLGTLVAGVAHEINNPLAYMRLNYDFNQMEVKELTARTDLPQDAREVLAHMAERGESIAKGLDVIGNVVTNLRLLSKRDTRELVLQDINALLKEAENVACFNRPPHTVAKLDLRATKEVRVNRMEMFQVILNLLMNAADALKTTSEPQINLRSLDKGPSVVIEVEDNGPGIPSAMQEKIFTPFHTTKPQGTGLGLSISQRIVTSHGGTIHFESRPGKTIFRIELPRIETATGMAV